MNSLTNTTTLIGLGCIFILFLFLALGLTVTIFTKDCPKCNGSRRIYVNGVDYTCVTCKGMGAVNRSFKEWMNGIRKRKNNTH